MNRIFTIKGTKVWWPSFLFLLGCLYGLSGCGETIDLYGESRMERADPVDSTSLGEGTVHRNPKPQKDEVSKSQPDHQTDYGASDGIFMIVPPAQMNPNNLKSAQDPQLITIDFQKGFEWLPTVVKVNGKLIFNERLRSKPNGFADSVSFYYEKPPAKFTLEFPTLGLSETFTVDPAKGRFLGISFVNNQLSLSLQEGPFFYETK